MKKNGNAIFFVFMLAVIFVACTKEPSKSNDVNFTPTGNPVIDGFSKEIAANPDNASLYAQRAAAYYELEGFDEAISDLKTAIGLDSVQIPYHHLLADVYLDYYKSREALETMYQAEKLFPKSLPTKLKLSEFQFILKRNTQSLKTLDNILKIDPQNADAFFMIGMNLKETGDTTKAINSFQTAVEHNPDLIDAWILLGKLYAAQNNPLAPRFFDNAIALDTSNLEARMGKAVHYQRQGDWDQALDTYKKIIHIDPQYANAYYNIGLLHFEKEAYDKAKDNFSIATKVDPLNDRAYYYRGLASEFLKDFSSAQKDYEQALRINPDYAFAQEALARVKKLIN